MNKIEKLIWEQLDYHNNDIMKKIHDAAMTQRGKPEITMGRVVKQLLDIGCPSIITDRLEHFGDLSHRAQWGFGTVGNVNEKVSGVSVRIIMGEGRFRSFYDEVHSSIIEIIKYRAEEKGEVISDDEIHKRKQNIIKESIPLLNEYYYSHKEYNKPITKAGEMGKQIAMDFSAYSKFVLKGEDSAILKSRLRENIQWLREWVEKIHSVESEEEQYNVFVEGALKISIPKI